MEAQRVAIEMSIRTSAHLVPSLGRSCQGMSVRYYIRRVHQRSDMAFWSCPYSTISRNRECQYDTVFVGKRSRFSSRVHNSRYQDLGVVSDES